MQQHPAVFRQPHGQQPKKRRFQEPPAVIQAAGQPQWLVVLDDTGVTGVALFLVGWAEDLTSAASPLLADVASCLPRDRSRSNHHVSGDNIIQFQQPIGLRCLRLHVFDDPVVLGATRLQACVPLPEDGWPLLRSATVGGEPLSVVEPTLVRGNVKTFRAHCGWENVLHLRDEASKSRVCRMPTPGG